MDACAAGRSENRLDLLYFTYFCLLLEKISGLYIIGLCQIVSTVTVPLDPSSLYSERHKQVLTAADCFDIHLITGTTSQSDSSSEQHNIFHARGKSQINHFQLTINRKKPVR